MSLPTPDEVLGKKKKTSLPTPNEVLGAKPKVQETTAQPTKKEFEYRTDYPGGLINPLNVLGRVGNSPFTKTVGNIGQAVYTPGAAFGVVGAAYKGAGAGLSKLAPKVGLGTSLGSKVAQEAVKEGVTGIPLAAGNVLAQGETNLKEVAKQGAIGGVIGLGTGAALPIVGAGIKTGIKNFREQGLNRELKEFITRADNNIQVNEPIKPRAESFKETPAREFPGYQGETLTTRQAAAASDIGAGGGNAETFRGKISRDLKTEKKSFAERAEILRGKTVDDLAALEGLETRVKGKLSSAEDSLYKSARLYKGLPEKSLQVVKERLTPVVQSIENLGYTSDDLGDYALAVHARDVNQKGIQSGMTNAEINDVIAKYGTPEMEAARKELLKVNNDMLETLVEGQVITRELVDTLKEKHPNYMALFREMDDEAVGFASGLSKALVNVSSPIKSLVGSKKKVIDPLESMVKNIFQSTQAAERNKVALQLSKLSQIDADAKFIRKVDAGEKVERKNVVSVLENGEKVKYEVEPEVYKALLNLDQQSSNVLVDILSKPASVLRAGATLTPEFSLRNPIRDIGQAYATSKSGFNPLVDFPVALFDVISGKTGKGGQLYKQWLDDMGGYGNIVSMDRKMHREALSTVLQEPNSKKFVNIINGKSLIGVLRSIADATESATKLGEYRAALRSGATRPEAAYRSRDVMDFARAGSSVRQVNKIIAFFNANIQGKSKVYRALKENPAGFTARAFTAVTVPTIGVFMMQKYMANETQQQTIADAPSWMRNTFWLIPVPGTDLVARLPKPFDLSIPFSNIIERVLSYAFNNEKEAFQGFARESASSTALPTQITGMLPVLEGMANYSFFREGTIIPRREENLQFRDQYDSTTSGTARVLARGAEKLTGGQGAFKNFSSPRIMDNTIKGITAGLGTYATSFADFIAEQVGATDNPDKPEKGITQKPLAKAFLVNENQSAKSLDYVFKEKDKLTKEKGSAKLNKEPFKDGSRLRFLNSQTETISDISKRIRGIRDNKNMSPAEKKQRIDQLTEKRNEIARKAEEKLRN